MPEATDDERAQATENLREYLVLMATASLRIATEEAGGALPELKEEV